MAKIEMKFDNVTHEVPDGTRLLDLCNQKNSVLPFGCQNAICGTCLIKVLEGMENLNPISDKERDTLLKMNAEPNQRLGCQAVIQKGKVVIDLG